jgi:hypothetical protein
MIGSAIGVLRREGADLGGADAGVAYTGVGAGLGGGAEAGVYTGGGVVTGREAAAPSILTVAACVEEPLLETAAVNS